MFYLLINIPITLEGSKIVIQHRLIIVLVPTRRVIAIVYFINWFNGMK